MSDASWLHIKSSLVKAIEDWSERICEKDEWAITGYWYPDQANDMAEAAMAVMKGSARGQEFYKSENEEEED